ncbi:MAG TPA: S8 family peptidase [Mycobacteriales bacterium]|nr:S8 family peptidase [Mycobacteriales bacterium]
MAATGSRTRRALLATGAVVAALVPAVGAGGAAVTTPTIVEAASVATAQAAVTSVGGKVTLQLPLVNGVLSSLTAAQLSSVQAINGVRTAADETISLTMEPEKGKPSPPAAPSTSPPPPAHPRDGVFPAVTGASSLTASGTTGKGIAVAVIDTGIAPLPDFKGRMLPGKDFTSANNAYQDTYGHGTFIAGLIAGNGASTGGQYIGEAPGANLVSVRVAGSSGTADTATVINAIDWVIQNAGAKGIRVVNLSLGQIPQTPTLLNPLDQAVEKAWLSGLVVVTSAGNNGSQPGTIVAPGDDPLVITVGAFDDYGTTATTDDTIPSFSSVGPTSSDAWWKPDLVAPGKSVVSLAASGSVIYNANKTARVGKAAFVGSGTSFSAAITSGAVALLLQTKPTVTPDAVKAALLTTTDPGAAPDYDPFVEGHGDLNVARAVAEPALGLLQDVSGIAAPVLGQLIPLTGTQLVSSWSPANFSGDATLDPTKFHSSSWNSSSWNSSSWNSSSWNSSSWNSSSWNSSSWNSSSWNSSSWN